MTPAVDTNVIVALWDKDVSLSSGAQSALDEALGLGGRVVAAPVFAELAACPGRDETFLDSFFGETGIAIDWTLIFTLLTAPFSRATLARLFY